MEDPPAAMPEQLLSVHNERPRLNRLLKNSIRRMAEVSILA
jgi:hypothetical protein